MSHSLLNVQKMKSIDISWMPNIFHIKQISEQNDLHILSDGILQLLFL